VSRHGHRLWIRIGWSSWARWRTAAVAVVGLSGISVAVTFVLHALGRLEPNAAAIVNGVVLAAALAGALLLVTARTSVQVEDGCIRVRHRRFLLPVTRTCHTEGLAQLFSVRARERDGVRTWFRFHLVALGKDGRKAILVPNLKAREQALYLETAIEEHLGIEDRPVRGEIRRVASGFKAPADRPRRRWRLGPLLLRQFVSHPQLSRRKFDRDIRFMMTGREFKAQNWRGKSRRKSRD
jgi:hypothetical protein